MEEKEKIYIDIPPSEKWLFDNEKAFASVQQGLADAAEGRIQKFEIFEFFVIEEGRSQLNASEAEKSLKKRYKAVIRQSAFYPQIQGIKV